MSIFHIPMFVIDKQIYNKFPLKEQYFIRFNNKNSNLVLLEKTDDFLPAATVAVHL